MTDRPPQKLSPELSVGLSISSPSALTPGLVARGMGQIHVRHAFIEIVRHVLSAGGGVAYGGDLRVSGYTSHLFELVRAYTGPSEIAPERVRSYLAWPLFDDLSTRERAEIKPIATLVRVDPPEGAPTELPPPGDRNGEQRAWAARSFTEMREALASTVRAQVVLGGRTSGQTGLVPGIAEEAALALRHGNALYPLAAFGGCVAPVVEALQGATPEELTLDHQREAGSETFREMVAVIGEDRARAEVDAVVDQLRSAGWPALDNGLSADENLTLVTSTNVQEIVILILRGLTALAL